MLAEIDYSGIAQLFGAIASTLGAGAAFIAARRVSDVRHEVKTMNELTLGQLGEAGETRRIRLIDPDQRTERETRHLRDSKEDQ